MDNRIAHALVLTFILLAPPLLAQSDPRRPRGIYAIVNVEENIKKEQVANPSVTPAELNPISSIFIRICSTTRQSQVWPCG